ncbi:MAG: alpha/beta fold hydrolase [Acidimicrobiaceae bacterium]|nr:alpha/beta fold hydrolase [Acidimicrobiaceae bacterium]
MAGVPPSLPPGQMVTIPGRGDTWVWEAPGPPGAPTVVLLHGWMSTAALNWCGVFDELSGSFRVIAPDHRGHGRGLRGAGFSLEECADDVAALVELFGLSHVTAVGYSMGGPIAGLLWRRHPGLVDGLVLCATAARFAGRPELSPVVQVVGRGMAWAVGWVPPRLVRDGAACLSRVRGQRETTPDPWVLAESEGGSPAAFIQAATALNALDARGWIPDIDVPTAVVVTTEDRMVSPDRQRWLADVIPGAIAYEVRGDHRACIDNAPEFAATLLDACIEVTTRSVSGVAAGRALTAPVNSGPLDTMPPTPEPA